MKKILKKIIHALLQRLETTEDEVCDRKPRNWRHFFRRRGGSGGRGFFSKRLLMAPKPVPQWRDPDGTLSGERPSADEHRHMEIELGAAAAEEFDRHKTDPNTGEIWDDTYNTAAPRRPNPLLLKMRQSPSNTPEDDG